jgi:hypothetical protein
MHTFQSKEGERPRGKLVGVESSAGSLSVGNLVRSLGGFSFLFRTEGSWLYIRSAGRSWGLGLGSCVGLDMVTM